ncbi:hypothetical protein N7524_006417 [Penicillium chrysogenum]|nr:hypothetical protein N7524_006417 [Penicillium chrysogenum]
MATLSKA